MRWFISCVVLLFVLSEPAFAQARFPFTALTVSDRVNVRAGQNNNFESVAMLAKGTVVIVAAKSFQWFKVFLPLGSKAFVKGEYVRMLTPEQGEITADHLNVRAASNPSATSLGLLDQGQKVIVQGGPDDWLWIKPVDGRLYGWIHESLLAFKSDGVPAKQAPASGQK